MKDLGNCVCHGLPMVGNATFRTCAIKARARTQRYHASAGGRVAKDLANGRRVYIGRRYVCSARTPGEATALNAHIKEQLIEFQQRLSGRAQAQATTPV